MLKLSDIGIGKSVELAQAPKCEGESCKDCKSKECNSVILGSNFKSKEEAIGFAINVCDSWDCPHTFIFIKFKDNEYAVGFHELIEQGDTESEDKYDWHVYKMKYSDVKSIRSYIAEVGEIHFAIVMEQNIEGNFKIITK